MRKEREEQYKKISKMQRDPLLSICDKYMSDEEFSQRFMFSQGLTIYTPIGVHLDDVQYVQRLEALVLQNTKVFLQIQKDYSAMVYDRVRKIPNRIQVVFSCNFFLNGWMMFYKMYDKKKI